MATTKVRPLPTIHDVNKARTALGEAINGVEKIALAIRPDDPDVYPLTPPLPDAELAMRLILFAENQLADEIEQLKDLRSDIREYARERYWTHMYEPDQKAGS